MVRYAYWAMVVIGVFFVGITILPFLVVKVISLGAAAMTVYFGIYIKSLEKQELPDLPATTHSATLPHKVKIVTRVKANLDKLQFVLTSAQFRPSWDHLAFKADQLSDTDLKVHYLSIAEGIYTESLSFKFINDSTN